jgi:hypothetical protein
MYKFKIQRRWVVGSKMPSWVYCCEGVLSARQSPNGGWHGIVTVTSILFHLLSLSSSPSALSKIRTLLITCYLVLPSRAKGEQRQIRQILWIQASFQFPLCKPWFKKELQEAYHVMIAQVKKIHIFLAHRSREFFVPCFSPIWYRGASPQAWGLILIIVASRHGLRVARTRVLESFSTLGFHAGISLLNHHVENWLAECV